MNKHSDSAYESGEEITMKNPLIVVVGIGEYDKNTFPNLIGVKRDYFNIKYVFNHMRGYSIVYQTTSNRICYINQRTRREKDVKDTFKIKWTEEEIEEFNDYITDNILCQDEKKSQNDFKSNENGNVNEKNEKHDGLIYFVSCHGGDESVIYDSEGEEFNLAFLYDQFDNENCPYLRKKPKMFFLDCCRGRMKSKRKYDDNNSTSYNNAESKDDEKQMTMNNNDNTVITKGGKDNYKQSGDKQDKTYIKARDSCKIFANTDGYATVDGGAAGGYLIQSVTKSFHRDRIFKKEFVDIRNHISRMMLKFMGKSVDSAVNVVEYQGTIDYTIKFQEKD